MSNTRDNQNPAVHGGSIKKLFAILRTLFTREPAKPPRRQFLDEKYSYRHSKRGYSTLDRDFGCDWGEE